MLSWDFDDSPPRAWREYLRDLAEFNRWFGSEANAVRYLTAVRFRSGIACPRCGMTITQPGRPRWWCGACRLWFTVTVHRLLELSDPSRADEGARHDVARRRLASRADQDRRPADNWHQLRHGVAAALDADPGGR